MIAILKALWAGLQALATSGALTEAWRSFNDWRARRAQDKIDRKAEVEQREKEIDQAVESGSRSDLGRAVSRADDELP